MSLLTSLLAPRQNGTSRAGDYADIGGASAGNAGHFYFATDIDGGTLYRSNGTSWVEAAPGVSYGVDQPIVIPAMAFGTTFGTPVAGKIGTSQRMASWGLPDAATSGVAANTFIPTHWAEWTAAVWFGTDVADTAAAVRINLTLTTPTVGLNVSNDAAVHTLTPTVPAQYVLGSVEHTGITRTGNLGVDVKRVGGDAADTYTGEIEFAGVKITRTA